MAGWTISDLRSWDPGQGTGPRRSLAWTPPEEAGQARSVGDAVSDAVIAKSAKKWRFS